MSIKIKFCDFWSGYDFKNSIVYKILDKYFDIELSDSPEYLIYSDFSHEHLKYNCVKIHYTAENSRWDANLADFGIGYDYSDSPKYLRFPLYVSYFDDEYTLSKLLRKKSSTDIDEILNRKKNFCCFIISNKKSSKRIDFFNKLSKYKRVDSGGGVLNNIGGRVENKLEFLKSYKFTIAFENSSYPGYTTEKVLQPFHVNTIPIYWGNPVIHEEFNSNSFLNWHDYGNDDALIEEIIRVDNDEKLFRQYLNENLFYDNQKNIYFSEEKFVIFFEKVFRERKTQVKGHERKRGMLLESYRALNTKIGHKLRDMF